MNRVIVMTHGNLADQLLKTVSLFLGPCENVGVFNLLDDPEAMRTALRAELTGGEDADYLLLVDLFGGTPFNIAASLLGEAKAAGKRVELITGVNLPMLMEVIPNIEDSTFEELKQTAYEEGRLGIRDLLAELNQQRT